jgi:hypothetical protein
MKNQIMIPVTAAELAAMPRARATRITYPWMGKTYTVWIGEAPFFGWSVLADYGRPGDECVVTSPHNREDCISALAPYMEDYGAVAVEWEFVHRIHDAWINHVRASRSVHWAPLPEYDRSRL